MKRKTTLYLEEEDVKKLKKIAIEDPGQNMTSLITKAINNFISERKNGGNSFNLFKKCKNKVKKNYFGESVKFQRKLREEWGD